MKNIIYIVMIFLASCTKSFQDVNTDPNSFTKVSPEASIEAAVWKLNYQMETRNSDKFWEMSHFITPPGTRYDATDAGLWQTLYVNVLENLQQVLVNYGTDTAFTNRVQIARILECYAYSILVGTYGAIPVMQANNLNYLNTIAFDNEDTVYNYILTNLKDAASKINLTKQSDKLTYDVVYGSDANSLLRWVKFANTLRLKIALRCKRNLGSMATAHIQDVMANEANTIVTEAETAKMKHENVSGNENYNYQNYIKVVSSLGMPRLNDFFFTFLRSYQDPRLNVYFDSSSVSIANRYLLTTDTLSSTKDDSLRIVSYPIPFFGEPLSPNTLSGWTALTTQTSPLSGTSSAPATNTYSYPAAVFFNNPAQPFIMLSYAEACFLKAEAAQLSLGGSQAASAYYYAGIAANFAYWGLSNGALTTYENTNGIKWGTAGTGFNNYLGIVNCNIPQADINKIWTQSWINYYPDQAFDAYTLQLRTRSLNFPPHTNPGGNSAAYLPVPYADMPMRYSYPTQIKQVDPAGYQSALTQLGVYGVYPDDLFMYIPLHYEVPYTIPNWNNANASYDMRFVQKWYGTTIQALNSAAQSAGFASRVTVTKTFHP